MTVSEVIILLLQPNIFFYIPAVTVGIVVDKNVFSEENQRADFNISVLTGQLQASFSVLYSTQPGSAMGILNIKYPYVYHLFQKG